MSERAVPVPLPLLRQQDLWPHEEAHGSWECRACLRAFSLKMLGLVRPSGPPGSRRHERHHRHGPQVPGHRHRGPQPRGAARAGLALGRRARAGAGRATSSSGRPRRSATGSASPRRWATPCSPTSPPRSVPGIDVVFLDTGYHFVETIGTRDAVAGTLDVNLITITPVQTVAEQDAAYGKDLYKTDPDLCCKLRKVQPLADCARGVRRLGDRAAPRRDPQPGDRAGHRLGRQEGQGQGLSAGSLDRRAGRAVRREATASWSTRSSTTATRRSAARRAPAGSRRARTPAAAAGPAPPRPSAGSTHEHPEQAATKGGTT